MDGSVIIKAVLDTADVTKGVKDVNKSLGGVTWKGIKEGDAAAQKLSGSLKGAGAAATVGLTAPILAAGAAAFGTASSYEQATSRIQSALGLTSEEAERLGDVGEGIYESGFGESLDAVSGALITVRENLGEVNDADLSAVTKGALTLEQTLGMDMTETVRGASALMKGFGMDGGAAMDLITAGAQNGLNLSDELGDNLAEYAGLFAQSGYSASEMFSVLQAGLDAGAYNLDKVNDLVKEFGIRVADGSVADAVAGLGGNFKSLYDEMSAGGASNKEIFSALAGEISKLGSEQEKAAAISAIFGSQGEDNGIKVIEAMAGVADGYADVAGASEEAGAAASDSFAAKSAQAMRELQGAIEPLGEPLLNIAGNVADAVSAFGQWFSGIGEGGQMAVLALAGILAAAGPVLSVAGNLVAVMPALTGALGGAGAAAGAASTGLLSVVTAAAPIIAAVGAIAAAIVYLWNTDDGFRSSVIEAWNAIWGSIQSVIGQLRPYVEQAWAAIRDAATAAMGVIGPVVSAGFQFIIAVALPVLQQLLANVGSTFSVILSTIAGVMNGISQVISGAWTLIKGVFMTVLGLIQGIVTGDFSMMRDGIRGIMSGILGIVTGVWNTIASVVSGVVNGIVSGIQGGFNLALSVVQGVFSGIEGAISGAMNGARSVVGDVIGAIKGFFNFRISWPHIPLPHINYDLIEVPVLGKIPNPATLSVSWYAKGAVFNGPSVIGVGEAGPEAVVPLSGQRMQPFADAVAEGVARVLAESGRGGGRGDVYQSFTFNQPVQSPDEFARAVRLQERYGLGAVI